MVRHTQSLMAPMGLALGMVAVTAISAQGAPAETAPASLQSYIQAIETAANARNIEQLMALYAADFQGPDGFTREQYQTTLSQFWAQYNTLTYDVELLSWTADGNAFVAETLTTMEGVQQTSGRGMTLTAAVRSQQRYENGQIVSQEILAEESQLVAGAAPPMLDINLPETVAPGAEYSFDAIVTEPLGDRILLGIALDEGVTPTDFLTPRPLDLQALNAGGLFKVGTAPDTTDQRWISAVLIRDDGMVIHTQRLRVEP